jgi:hypothetical protein
MDLRTAASRLPVDRAIDADMASHHGVTTHDRVHELGGTRNLIDNRLRTGKWIAAYRGVYRDAAVPRSAEQDALAAVLAAGERAESSHLSSVWLWGLLARAPDLPHVVVPYDRCVPHPGFVLHRSTDLVGGGIHVRRGIPTTDPARAILDTAGIVPPSVTALIVDRAISTKLVTVAGLIAVLDRYGRRGRRGAGKLRRVLDERGVSAATRAPSVLESRMARIARTINAPAPVPEFQVGRYFLDFAWPEVMVAVEVDGWDGHTAYDDWLRNMEKRNWCGGQGWLILAFAWEHVQRHPERIAYEIQAAIGRRRLALTA